MIDFSLLPKAKILVCGDVMLDRYWYGETQRVSPEGPIPIVNVKDEDLRPGGAGNVALGVQALGASVQLLGLVGDDVAGRQLQDYFIRKKMAAELQVLDHQKTIDKLRVISRNRQVLRLDREETYHTVDKQKLQQRFCDLLNGVSLAVLSDYAKGTLSHPQQFIQAARQNNVPIIVDPKGRDFSLYQHATLLTPNFGEFEAVVGHCQHEYEIEQRGQALVQQLQLEALLITRSERGMTLIRTGKPAAHLPARACEVYDVTGAGDTVVAALACAVGAGMDLIAAMELANTAAAVAVKHLGAVPVSLEALHLASDKVVLANKVIHCDADNPPSYLENAQQRGETIAFVSGCFDVIHARHIRELTKAREQKDHLLVGVYNDSLTSKRLGDNRPLHTLEQRMQLLSHLECIDWLVPIHTSSQEETLVKYSHST